MNTRWTVSEVDSGDEALACLHHDFGAAARATWTSPKQVLVLDWFWPDHLNRIDKLGTEDDFALTLTYDGAPGGVAFCRRYHMGESCIVSVDFFYLKRALWETILWEEAIAAVRDRLAQPSSVQEVSFGIPALGRFADDRSILERLGFTNYEEWGWYVISLDTALPLVVVPASYSIVPWSDQYRIHVEQLDCESPVILGGLCESRHLRLDCRASYVALQGEEVCGAILVREPTTAGGSFIEYLVVAEAHRRRGLGRALKLAAMADLKARGVVCLGSCLHTGNTSILAMNGQLGAVPLGFTGLSCTWPRP